VQYITLSCAFVGAIRPGFARIFDESPLPVRVSALAHLVPVAFFSTLRDGWLQQHREGMGYDVRRRLGQPRNNRADRSIGPFGHSPFANLDGREALDLPRDIGSSLQTEGLPNSRSKHKSGLE